MSESPLSILAHHENHLDHPVPFPRHRPVRVKRNVTISSPLAAAGFPPRGGYFRNDDENANRLGSL